MGRQSFGTIDKRGTTSKPRYRARFDDPTHTGPGRAPRISAPHTFPTKREAEIWLAAQWSAIAAGTWEHPAAVAAREAEHERQQTLKGLTVAEWADMWLANLERTAAAGTLRKRRSDLRRHILPYIGDTELAALTSASLSQWWADLDAKPGARRNAYETMRALLNSAVADDRTLLTANPLSIKGGAREARTIQKYLYSPAEVAALADEMPARYRALVVLLADAGLRINEALALTRASLIERADGGMSVRVEHSLHRAGRRLEPGPTKTAAGVRTVALMAATTTTMRTHLRTHVDEGPSAILFPAPSGSGYARDTALTRILTAAHDRARIAIPSGMSGGWHALRHYSATRYGQAGATTRALMTRYGWSDPDMAARYQRSDEEYERELVARMEARTDRH
jgi:integrase